MFLQLVDIFTLREAEAHNLTTNIKYFLVSLSSVGVNNAFATTIDMVSCTNKKKKGIKELQSCLSKNSVFLPMRRKLLMTNLDMSVIFLKNNEIFVFRGRSQTTLTSFWLF